MGPDRTPASAETVCSAWVSREMLVVLLFHNLCVKVDHALSLEQWTRRMFVRLSLFLSRCRFSFCSYFVPSVELTGDDVLKNIYYIHMTRSVHTACAADVSLTLPN